MARRPPNGAAGASKYEEEENEIRARDIFNMSDSHEPLISVLTPFYNAAEFLAECIESVLAQTYKNFEYLLVNNCSTDGSAEIAEAYARKDPRIRIRNNSRFLPQLTNFNGALELISPASQFTKMVLADDKIFPTCLAEMVRVANASPRVGMVGSFVLRDSKVEPRGYPFEEEVVPGRLLCREQLLRSTRYFFSPTTVLYRSDLVRTKRPFYDERRLHADTENGFEILLEWDFGFVKQILTFMRVENESLTSAISAIDPIWYLLDHLIVTRRFGQGLLSPAEFRKCWKRTESLYLRHVGGCYFLVRDPRFWARHRAGVASIDYQPSRFRLIGNGMRAVATLPLHPSRWGGLCKKIWSRVKGYRGFATTTTLQPQARL